MRLPFYAKHLFRIALALAFLLYLGVQFGAVKIRSHTINGILSLIGLGRGDLLRIVHAFPHGTSISSIAVQRDGQLLVTLMSAPEIWSIDPFSRSANLVHRFVDARSVVGIAETEHEVFVVATGNRTVEGLGEVGSVSLASL